MLGEDGEFIRLAVAIGVLADFDAVVSLAGYRHAMRIVARLRDPAAAPLVPGEADRFHNFRLRCKKFEAEIRSDLGALHATFHGERELVSQGLRAAFVVGYRCP